MKNTVIFDMDGVLFDSERMIMECWDELSKEKGFGDVKPVCISCMGLNRVSSAKVFKAAFGEDFPYMEYKEEVTRRFFEKCIRDGVCLMKGVFELLNYLRDNNYRIALASSTSGESVEKMLVKAKIRDYFEVVISGDMVKNSKPAPEIYLMACDRLGVSPHDCYAIEDSFNGVRSASSAEIDTIMVPDMAKPDEEMKTLAKIILPDLLAVLDYLTGE